MPSDFLTPRQQRRIEKQFQKLDKKHARVQKKALRASAPAPTALSGPRDWSPSEPSTSSRSSSSRMTRWVAPLLILALLAGSVAWLGRTSPVPLESLVSSGSPPPGVGAEDEPLGAPPEVQGEGGYSFLETQEGSSDPVAWDPCREIRYVVSGTPPPGGEVLLDRAVAELSAATGLRFVSEGVTSEQPSSGRSAYQPELYGNRWAPLLVAWTSPGVVPELEGSTIGVGGPARASDSSGVEVYVPGSVDFDVPQFVQAAQRDESAPLYGVVLHELMHAMGLDHVKDPSQIMHAESSTTAPVLGEGDRRGLAMLGKGPCSRLL